MSIHYHHTDQPSERQQDPPRRKGYVRAHIITETFQISHVELIDMAIGDPVLVRSVVVDGERLYCWGDALLVSLIMTRVSRQETDLW